MHDAATEDRIRAALSFLDPSCDRATWVKLGMCIKNEMGEAGFDAWNEWSSGSDKYRESDARSTWRSIKADGSRTIATLFWEAKQAGWKDDTKRKKLTAAEIQARKDAQDARARAEAEREALEHQQAAQWAQRLWEAATPVEGDGHPYLKRKGVVSHGLRVGRWERLDPETGEFLTVTSQGLLIPIRDNKKMLWSLQCIHPDPSQKKLYLKGGKKRGNFAVLGTKPIAHDGRPVFILAEGYATAATVHAATGHLVLCVFDASNLMTVATALRQSKPDALIVLAADNDTETEGNPGVTQAKAAAKAVAGLVVVPPPGDFNDLQGAEGGEAVAAMFDLERLVASSAPAPTPAPPPAEPAPAPSPEAPAQAEPPDDGAEYLQDADPSAHFTVLGYDRDDYFVFIHETRQITVMQPGSLASESVMLRMAPLEWWEEFFPGEKGGINKKLAANWFFRLAHRRGIYDIARVRGRGAWVDDGRVVYHQGSCLYVDGQSIDVHRIKSRYVYELAKTQARPAEQALSDEDGRRILDTAKLFRWTKPGAAALLAGWTFLAPICGAIRWRPHVWLTGGAGSGKSTILNEFVSPLVGDAKVFAQGNSTEAGIRQRLKADALPVLFDESEKNNEAEKKRMDGVIAMIRQSSTESVAQTLKGTLSGDSMAFHVRSMFCLASIQAGLEHKADVDRLTKLSLQAAQDGADSSATWSKIKDALYVIQRDTDLPSRMLRRALDMLPAIQANIDVFVDVAASVFGTQRMGDQYGTMLAGAWSLHRSKVATADEARAMIQAYDWTEFTEGGEVDDAEKALQTLLEAKVLNKGESFSVGSLVSAAVGVAIDGLSLDDKLALRLLRENGMTVHDKMLAFANNSEALRKLVGGTKFESDLRGQLLRLPGARRLGTTRFAPGVVQRAVGIPLAAVVDDEPPL